MPIKNRNYKHEYQLQKKRGETEARAERQRARREYDKKGIDREGKQIHHVKALANGGKNKVDGKSNTRLVSPSENLSFPRKSNHKPK